MCSYRFSQLKGSSDDGKLILRLDFQNDQNDLLDVWVRASCYQYEFYLVGKFCYWWKIFYFKNTKFGLKISVLGNSEAKLHLWPHIISSVGNLQQFVGMGTFCLHTFSTHCVAKNSIDISCAVVVDDRMAYFVPLGLLCGSLSRILD